MPTSLAIASSNPSIAKTPSGVVFAAGSYSADQIAVLRSGSATIEIEMPASRGGRKIQAVINTGGAPSLESIHPTSGPAAGGTRVTLLGRNLGPQCTVTFGDLASANIVAADGGLLVTTPPHSGGYTDVRVTCGDEQRALVQAFAFVAPRRRSAN